VNNMIKVKEIVKELKLFERNKIPLEIKILGIAIYIQTSSVRKTAKILSEFHSVSKSAVHKWIKKFEERLPISTERKPRKIIAIDETIVKANGEKYYIYAAIDIEKNELILMRVYQEIITTKLEILKYCKPKFVVDKASWLIKALKSLGLEYEHKTFQLG